MKLSAGRSPRPAAGPPRFFPRRSASRRLQISLFENRGRRRAALPAGTRGLAAAYAIDVRRTGNPDGLLDQLALFCWIDGIIVHNYQAMQETLVVFVCSTYSDLTSERAAVLEAIRRLQLQHDSMEYFGARPDRPIETCLAEVERSNILIIIVGHRYGTMLPGGDLSFPHAEYEAGYGKGKPCLVYFRNEDVPVLPKYVERDAAKIDRLERWKAILRERHTVATFRDAHDLALHVAADLGRTLKAIEDAQEAEQRSPTALVPTLLSGVQTAVNAAMRRGMPHIEVVHALRLAIEALTPARDLRTPVVLITSAPEDSDHARVATEALQQAGMTVLDDLQRRVETVNAADEALVGIDCIVFFISSASIGASEIQSAWNFAVVRRIAAGHATMFVPVLIESADVPPLFRDAHVLDLRGEPADVVAARIVTAVTEQVG